MVIGVPLSFLHIFKEFILNKLSTRLPITDYLITDYRLPITDYPITDYPITDYQLLKKPRSVGHRFVDGS